MWLRLPAPVCVYVCLGQGGGGSERLGDGGEGGHQGEVTAGGIWGSGRSQLPDYNSDPGQWGEVRKSGSCFSGQGVRPLDSDSL